MRILTCALIGWMLLAVVHGAEKKGSVPQSSSKSIEDVAREYFESHPNEEISQQQVSDHIRSIRPDAQDPWRTVRKLYQEGYLIKVRKGVYKQVPGYRGEADDEPFTSSVRRLIFERDASRCLVCGDGPHNGVEIHADHIRPRHLGGKSTLENGQTLCSRHNILKKTYGTYDFYAQLVARLEQEAHAAKDESHAEMLAKIRKILEDYGYTPK